MKNTLMLVACLAAFVAVLVELRGEVRGARPRWRCCFYAAVRWLGHTPYHSPRLAFVIAAVELGLAFRLLA